MIQCFVAAPAAGGRRCGARRDEGRGGFRTVGHTHILPSVHFAARGGFRELAVQLDSDYSAAVVANGFHNFYSLFSSRELSSLRSGGASLRNVDRTHRFFGAEKYDVLRILVRRLSCILSCQILTLPRLGAHSHHTCSLLMFGCHHSLSSLLVRGVVCTITLPLLSYSPHMLSAHDMLIYVRTNWIVACMY